MPFWLKHFLNYLSRGNSIVKIKYRWAYNLEQKLQWRFGGIDDIKEKFGGLRFYVHGTQELLDLENKVEAECNFVCQECGSLDNVKIRDFGWLYNLCDMCNKNYEERFKVRYNDKKI